MKKIFLVLILFFSFLDAYYNDDYQKLIEGKKNLSGADLTNLNIKNINLDGVNLSNADLSGSTLEYISLKNAKVNNSNLSNIKFINCEFKVIDLDKVSNVSNSIFIRTNINDKDYNVLINNGAFIPNIGIVCNSDLHVLEGSNQEKDKYKQLNKMINVTNDPKNNVKAIVIAGDLCGWGDSKFWDAFVNKYYKPLKKTGKHVLLTIGNHDRWQKESTFMEKLNMWGRSLLGLGSVVIEKVKDLNGGKIYYKKYVGSGVDIISLGECPTMTNKYNKGTLSWYKNLSHKYPEIIFFHYTPLAMIDWWTQSDSALPTDENRGKKALKYFNDNIKKYKDRIALMITGHEHSTFFDYWEGLPVITVGGRDRFALCHFYANKDLRVNECVAIEFISPDSKKASLFYYPCLEQK